MRALKRAPPGAFRRSPPPAGTPSAFSVTLGALLLLITLSAEAGGAECPVRLRDAEVGQFIETTKSALAKSGLNDLSALYQEVASSSEAAPENFVDRQLCPLTTSGRLSGENFADFVRGVEAATAGWKIGSWSSVTDSVFLALATTYDPKMFDTSLQSIASARKELESSDVESSVREKQLANFRLFEKRFKEAAEITSGNKDRIASRQAEIASLFGVKK